MLLFVPILILADSFIDDTEAEFALGDYGVSTQYNSTIEIIHINGSYSNGTYVSGVFDGGAGSVWNNISISKNYSFEMFRAGERDDGEKVINNISNTSITYYSNFNNNTDDLSNGGHSPTRIATDCALSVTGKLNTACDFNGVNSYINTDYQLIAWLGSNISVAFWFQANDLVNLEIPFGSLAEKGADDPLFGIYLNYPDANDVSTYWNDANDNQVFVNANEFLQDNNWHHAVAIKNSSGGGNVYKSFYGWAIYGNIQSSRYAYFFQ